MTTSSSLKVRILIVDVAHPWRPIVVGEIGPLPRGDGGVGGCSAHPKRGRHCYWMVNSWGLGVEVAKLAGAGGRGILMKLDLRDRVQAVIFAYETGVNRPAVRQSNPSAD